jgi:hypothetical protein
MQSKEVSMPEQKIKTPRKGGLDEARRMLKEMRRKEPSPELVKIIEEISNRDSEKKPETDIAAKPHVLDFD